MPIKRRTLLTVVAAFAGLILLLLVVRPSLNPFAETEIDRSQPAILKSIEDLGELTTARANLQVVVDLEKDVNNVPDFIKGERVLFIAAGTVDAVVDLRKIKDGDIKISDDRRKAMITLPRAVLRPARLDPRRSRVYDRDRGIIDRVGDAFSNKPGDEQPLYVAGTRKLEEAAAADPELRRRAEQNAAITLRGILSGLGFEKVDIRFAGKAPAPPAG